MDQLKFSLEYSIWFMPLIILISAGFSYILYSIMPRPWSKSENSFLFILRTVLLSILFFLLLSPFVYYFYNNEEKPIVIFSIDNSASIKLGTPEESLIKLKAQIKNWEQKLKDKNFNVVLFDGQNEITNVDSLKFNNKTTNLYKDFKSINESLGHKNIASIVHIGDGIINEGADVSNIPVTQKVFCIAIGDTIAKKDIAIKNVLYNKISYINNQFPIVAEIKSNGYKGQTCQVVLQHKGKTIQSKDIYINDNNFFETITFYHNSQQKGVQHYEIKINPLQNELTYKNNIKNIFIDILESKENILIVSAFPHPDINAIKSAIDSKENYETNIYIPQVSTLKPINYNLIIAYQCDATNILGSQFFQKNPNIATWHIIGPSTNLLQFNKSNTLIEITPSNKIDIATATYNHLFSKFNISEQLKTDINKWGPIQVPYGNIKTKNEAEVLLFQKIGNTETDKPLFIIANDKKNGVLIGEGLWQWKLNNFQNTESHTSFNELITQIIKLLSNQETKQKFKVFPKEKDGDIENKTTFYTELYNDLYEPIFNQAITLKIITPDKKTLNYQYINTEFKGFDISFNKTGIYKYNATCTIGNQTFVSNGEFSLNEKEKESVTLTTNVSLLKNLAKINGGNYIHVSQINNDFPWTENIPHQIKIHTKEDFKELISFKWVFFILLGLVSLEWFFRKYKGDY